jgi:hypothetical protein
MFRKRSRKKILDGTTPAGLLGDRGAFAAISTHNI